MTGFQHDVAGGNGNLVVTSMQSPNFDPATGTGWQIAKDGSATFYSISLPGFDAGVKVTFSSTAPSSPNTGDVWYNVAEGLLAEQWNGTAWVTYQVGTGAIANGAITATQIDAGTVVAGIVNGTTITGGTLIISQGSGATYEEVEINGSTGVITWSKYQSPTVVTRTIAPNGTDLVYADPGNGGSQGALIQSDSALAGNDQFGTAYRPGVVYGAASQPQLWLAPTGAAGGVTNAAQLIFPMPGLASAWPDYPNIYGQVSGTGGILSLNGPVDSTGADQVFISLESASFGGNGAAYGFASYIDTSGTTHSGAYWGDNGFTIPAGTITAVKPGTGTSPSNPAVAETWHTASLENGWENAASTTILEYKKYPDNTVCVQGQIGGVAVTTDSTVFQLPTGYYSTTKNAYGPATILNDTSSPYTNGVMTLVVATNGQFRVYGSMTASQPLNVYFRFALDA